jgi:hypothetical protein
MCAGAFEDEGLKAMAAWRRAIELSLADAAVERLRSIAQSQTEPTSRVERARILLAYREDPSFFAVGPRPGKEPKITIEAKAWLTSLALPEGEGTGLSA